MGLIAPLKILLAVLCLFPQIATCITLNVLGCRWLIATNRLNALLLNALALEFVLMLPELLYKTMATKRSIHITQSTFVMDAELGDISVEGVFGSVSWFLASAVWAYLYIYHIQAAYLLLVRTVHFYCCY